MPCKVGSNDCNVSIISLFTYSMLCRQIMNFVWVQYMKEWFDRSDVIHLFRDVSIYSLNKWGFLHSPCIVSCDRLKGSGFTHHIILHMLHQNIKPSSFLNRKIILTPCTIDSILNHICLLPQILNPVLCVGHNFALSNHTIHWYDSRTFRDA